MYFSSQAWRLHLGLDNSHALNGETPVQVCLDAAGQPVDWWLALKLPGGPMWARLDSRGAAEALGASLGGTERVEGRFRWRRLGVVPSCFQL